MKRKSSSEKAGNKKTSAPFSVYPMPQATVMSTFLERDQFDLEPNYQREGNIWSMQKKQLLMDSLLNRYDIPKLYIHKLKGGAEVPYAVVDGKQRLASMWSFLQNEFPLSEDFTYLQDESIALAGLTYREIAKDYPIISAKFDGTQLPIMVIDTDEVELIEDLFSRLNEAVPLNSAEKRNAFGGEIPSVIRQLVGKNRFFTKNLPFTNRRYRHFDLACKFLYMSDVEEIVDIKRIKLDEFVKKYSQKPDNERVLEFSAHTKKILDVMSKIFVDNDRLLRNVGIVVPIFWLFHMAIKHDLYEKIKRSHFEKFEKDREKNRIQIQEGKKADFLLLRLDELNSTVNDAYAIQFKYALLAKHILPALLEVDPDIAQALKASS